MEYKRQFRGIGVSKDGKHQISKTYARVSDAKRWITSNNWHGWTSSWVEYVDTIDWKRWDDSLKDVPVASSKKPKPSHKAIVSMSNSQTNDLNMPLGHIIGSEIYKAMCDLYERVQLEGLVPGRLIIESSEGTYRDTTDYHIYLFTSEKV